MEHGFTVGLVGKAGDVTSDLRILECSPYVSNPRADYP